MASSTRRAAAPVVLLALLVEGCFTGHLLDHARRVERPIAYRDAAIDGDRLLLAYTVLVTDDLGYRLSTVERRAAVALADLRSTDVPVERFPVTRLPDGAALRGHRVALLSPRGTEHASPPFLVIDEASDGRPTRVVLHAFGEDFAPLYSGALARKRTALWAYPLLPFTVAFDAVTDPVLLFFAPAVIVLGD
jgi:hypothetical protein